MVHAHLFILARCFLVFGRPEVDEGEAVVFFVLGEEGQPVFSMLDLGFEDFGVPIDHLVIVMCRVDDVSELAWCNHCGPPGLSDGWMSSDYGPLVPRNMATSESA